MTFVAPDPVASGRPYKVSASVTGGPSDLNHFVGNTSFTIDKDGAQSVVRGSGFAHGTGVRFFEKDAEHSGKDVRTWHIAEHPAGQFFATAEATG